VTRRNSILLAGVALVAAVAAYWMLALSPKREEATKLSTQITTKESDLKAAEAELATYQKAQANFRANYALVARLGKAVPADDDVRSLMVQIDSAAGRSKVDFRTISMGASAAAPPAPAPSASDKSGSDQKGATATTPTPSATPPGAAPVGSAGFSSMPFQFSFRGSFFSLGEFFQRLDSFVDVNGKRMDVNGRLVLLDTITLAPDPAGFPKIRAQIGATTYLLPPTEGLLAGATSQGPGAGSPATPGQPGQATPGGSAPASPAPSGGATTTATIGAHR
jgi:hypothetical protein